MQREAPKSPYESLAKGQTSKGENTKGIPKSNCYEVDNKTEILDIKYHFRDIQFPIKKRVEKP